MRDTQFSYRIGEWLVEPHLNRLSKDGGDARQVEPKAMDILVYLLARSGEVVTSDELLDQLWTDRHGDPSMIHKRIGKIRRLMGDDARNPSYIETIRQRGYRTIARVETVAAPEVTDPNLLEQLQARTPPFPAYDGDGPYVFVCYAHTDRAAVYPELIRLRDAGVNIWYDEGISPGSEWTDELARAIAGCERMLYFVSPAAVESRNCRDEVHHARRLGKNFVTVFLEPVDLPDGLQLEIGRHQSLFKYQLSETDYQRKLQIAFDSRPPLRAPTEDASQSAKRRKGNGWARYVGFGLLVMALVAVVVWYGWRSSPSEEPVARPGIAVLPFLDMSREQNQEYLANGIAEEITNSLASIQGLKVSAPSSSFTFRDRSEDIAEIARVLGVSYLLDGSVRTSGDKIRVTTKLVDAGNHAQIWSERYDNHLMTDVFDIQDDIAAKIAERLRVDLVRSKRRGTRNSSALDAFLRGRQLQYRFDPKGAVAAYTDAVLLDPEYVEAWDGLARMHSTMYGGDASPERKALLDHALEKVLTVDPSHPYAQAALASQDANRDFQWQQAINAMHRLVAENPNDVRLLQEYANLLAATAQYQPAIEVFDRWLAVDPLNARALNGYGIYNVAVGELDLAQRASERLQALGERSITLEIALATARGDAQALLDIAEWTVEEWATYPSVVADAKTLKVVYHAVTGDVEKALEVAATIEWPNAELGHAKMAYWIDGDPSLLIELDRKRFHSWPYGRPWRPLPNFNPDWEPWMFQHLPEFQTVLKSVNLDDASVARLKVPPLAM